MTNITDPNFQDSLIERLAEIEHERWADWQAWCHHILRENCPSPELEAVLERWDRQIATTYKDLTESEKQSDRDQVNRYLPLFKDYIEAKCPEEYCEDVETMTPQQFRDYAIRELYSEYDKDIDVDDALQQYKSNLLEGLSDD